MDLQPQSQQMVNQYLAWGKQMQGRYAKDMEFDSTTFEEGRLFDGQYGKHEVSQMLKDHLNALQTETMKGHETALLAGSQLISAILRETDKHRIPLAINVNEVLSGCVRMSAVEQAEAQVIAMQGGVAKRGLAPLTAVDRGDQTAKQLFQAQEEIRNLNEKVRNLQQALTQAMEARSQATAQAFATQDSLTAQQYAQQESMKQLASHTMEERARVAALEQQVAMLNQELQGRLSQSTQFRELRRILNEKNQQVIQLRQALARYDPQAAMMGDDDIPPEDDD